MIIKEKCFIWTGILGQERTLMNSNKGTMDRKRATDMHKRTTKILSNDFLIFNTPLRNEIETKTRKKYKHTLLSWLWFHEFRLSASPFNPFCIIICAKPHDDLHQTKRWIHAFYRAICRKLCAFLSFKSLVIPSESLNHFIVSTLWNHKNQTKTG